MRLVPNLHSEGRRPTGLVPVECAVTGRGDDPEGFILTGRQLEGIDRDVNISIAAVKEMARMIGMISPGEVDAIRADLAELEERFTQAIAQVDAISKLKELEEQVAAFSEVAEPVAPEVEVPGEPEPEEEPESPETEDFAGKARKAVGI